MRPLKFCRSCRRYTLKDSCPGCGGMALSPKPPKYSPEDKYAEYRRKMKVDERKSRGIL